MPRRVRASRDRRSPFHRGEAPTGGATNRVWCPLLPDSNVTSRAPLAELRAPGFRRESTLAAAPGRGEEQGCRRRPVR